MLTRHAPKGGKWRGCGHSDKNTALFAPVLNAAQLVRHVKCLKKKRGKGRSGKWRKAGQGGVTEPPVSRTGRKHPSLFTEGKAGGLFAHLNGPQHSQKLSVLGKWGLQARGNLFIIDVLNTVI